MAAPPFPLRFQSAFPMIEIVLRRCIVVLPTLLLVSMLVFGMQKLLPGDPILTMAGEDRDPATIAYLQEKYRLNDPIPVQYVAWLGQIVRGDLGISLRTEQPVLGLIAQKLPVTIQLAAFAMIVAFMIGVPAGIISAIRKGTATDYAHQRRRAVGAFHSQFLARPHAYPAGVGAMAIAPGVRLHLALRGSSARTCAPC